MNNRHSSDFRRVWPLNAYLALLDAYSSQRQSRSQSPRSSVGGIVGLWEKAQKNAQNSPHSITIG